MAFTITREQLYELVWSEPMQRLSKQIGISDVAIAKHCRKAGIPVPERGYWNKLQAGQKVTRTPLSQRDLGTINRIVMSGTLSQELRSRLIGEPGVGDPHNEDIAVLTERLRKRLGTVTAPRNFARTHPVIEGLLKKDEKLRLEAARHPFPWNKPRFEAPFERRRLLFLNGLFLGFAKIGGAPWLRGPDARELAIYVGEASTRFQVDRVGAGTQQRRSARPAEKNDRLSLSIEGHDMPPDVTLRWEDKEGCPLEAQLTEIIVGMLVAGEHLHRRWIEQQARWEREQREEAEHAARRRKEEEERRAREREAALAKAKVDSLLQEAQSWRQALGLRDYVQAVRAAAGDRAATPELEDWSRWALAEADKLDPISSGHTFAALASETARGTDNGAGS